MHIYVGDPCTGCAPAQKQKKKIKTGFPSAVARVRQRPSTHASENGILTSLSYYYCNYYRNQLDTCSSSSFSASGNPNKHLVPKTSFYGAAFTRRRSEKYYHHQSIRNLSSSCISFFFFFSYTCTDTLSIYMYFYVHIHIRKSRITYARGRRTAGPP